MIDDRWDIKRQEAEALAQHDRAIASFQSALRIRNPIVALEGDPRFQVFLTSLKALAKDAEEELVRASSDVEMRQLQGRVRALREVADICANAKTEATRLEKQLQDAQSQKEQAVLRGGRVVPAGTKSWLETTAALVQPK